MEMRARGNVGAGRDLTSPLPPLAFSLYSSSLLSHCSSCFSPLSPPPPPPSTNPPVPLYCSDLCSRHDSALHLSSAEDHLLRSHQGGGDDTSDLRAALRLLRHFELLNLLPSQMERIGGLMSNREQLMSRSNGEEEDSELFDRVRDGAKAMAKARRMRGGLELEDAGECEVEEAVLCVVLTNAVEVQVCGGQGVGIAVYGVAFSWINHSCSPNACYRFLVGESSVCESPGLIIPASSSDGVEVMSYGDSNESEPDTVAVAKECGPRIVVRSIKAIGKGDEVFVAYTDLLQPKAMRQSELWSKYRFICSCQRCSSCPPTYADHTLQEIFVFNCGTAILNSDYRDEAINRFAIHVDDAINEYLTFGNANSCCDELERLLSNGIPYQQFELKEENSNHQLFLHPLHHLSLNAYTALSSAYRTRASNLLASHPWAGKIQVEAFDMSRTSAAYSLLLAGATHHLSLSEPSLVVSVANFWMEAGRSLLNVAKSSVWTLFRRMCSTTDALSFFNECCDCALIRMFKMGSGLGPTPNVVFEEISREFLKCVGDMTPKAWKFLIQKGRYLKLIEDPIDFCWTDNLNSVANVSRAAAESNVSGGGEFISSEPEIMNLFQLGVHCLLYGGYLSSTFCGRSPQYTENLFVVEN